MKNTHYLPKSIVLVGVLFLSGLSAWAQTALFGSSHTINSVTYNWDSYTEDSTFHTDTYLDGSSNTLTIRGKIGVSSLGEISGAFTGYYQSGSYYPYTDTFEKLSTCLTYNDSSYTTVSGYTSYTVDLDNTSVNLASFSHTYNGPGGSFTANGPNGSISGSEYGWVVNGSFCINTGYSNYWSVGSNWNTRTLFGATYYQTGEWGSTSYNQDGTSTTSNAYGYGTFDGGTFSEGWDSSSSNVNTSGNDPYVGNWSLVNGTTLSSSPQFSNRSAPTFLQDANTMVLWVNGTVVN